MEGGLTVLDIVLLAIVLLSGLLALMRGFVHEVLTFGAWIGAAIITLYAFPHLQPYARELIDIDLAADVATGVVTFLVALVLLILFAKLLAELVQGSRLSFLDRLLGLLFGLVRGAALICLAWLIFAWLVPPNKQPDWVRDLASLPYIQEGAALLQDLVPDSFISSIAPPRSEELLDPRTQPEAAPPADSSEPAYDSDTRDQLQRAIESLDGSGAGGSGSSGGTN